MARSKSMWLGLALVTLVVSSALADTKDAWLTTKAKIALLTAHGVSVTAVNVDTVEGAVTLHGKVKTSSEKEKATLAVKDVEGVKSVQNLLQVVPEAFKASVKATDDGIKAHVEGALKADKRVDEIKVASVNNGVVLLKGKARTLNEKLLAIELAWGVGGVSSVASEIEAGEK